MIVWRMPHSTVTIELTPEEREALAAIMRAGRGRADLAKRARIIVRLADGASYAVDSPSSERSHTIVTAPSTLYAVLNT